MRKQAVESHFGKFGVSKTIGGGAKPKRKPRKKRGGVDVEIVGVVLDGAWRGVLWAGSPTPGL